MKRILYIFLFITVPVLLAAQNAVSDTLSGINIRQSVVGDKIAGDSAYVKGDYETAITLYENLLKSNGESSDLYYNLGNAYYKNDNIAKAILNYERALLLDPSDEDLLFNIELARSKTVDKVAPVYKFFLMSWIEDIINLTDMQGWSVFGIVFFLLSLATFGLFLFGKSVSIRKTGFVVAVISLFVAIFANLSAYHQYHYLTERTEAIVMSASVTVKSTPSESGTDLFVIHEGRKVKISDDSMKEWKEIELEDGNIGWVPVNTIERI